MCGSPGFCRAGMFSSCGLRAAIVPDCFCLFAIGFDFSIVMAGIRVEVNPGIGRFIARQATLPWG